MKIQATDWEEIIPTIPNTGEAVEQLELYMVDTDADVQSLWKSLTVSYKITRSNPTTRFLPKTYSQTMRKENTTYVNAYSSSIHNHQKQEITQMSIKRMWSIYTMNYYSITLKSNKLSESQT